MNKTKKRQLHIRNKLIAAVAMLLVSSIMMVSTTYAWFTLSTAPEVQGITTTVGANGNLEIALSPLDGDVSKITSAMGDSNISDWADKNLTWGNLLDMSSSAYKLDEITLLPAQLDATGGKLSTSPLKTPVYGADGRISTLDSNTSVGTYDSETQGFVVSATNRGVRAIGTSSSMSPQQLAFYNNLSKMTTSMSAAQEKARTSLTANGAKLAEMAVNHANAGSEDTSDYSKYVPTLQAVISTLDQANDQLEQAIRAGLLAMASSSKSNSAIYDAITAVVNDGNSLIVIWEGDGTTAGIGTRVTEALGGDNPLTTSYNTWKNINTKIQAANTQLAGLGTGTVAWSDVSSVVSSIMDANNVKINDKTLSQFKELAALGIQEECPEGTDPSKHQEAREFVGSLTSGVRLQLAAGSGVYADLGSVVGNFDADVRIESLKYGNMSVPYVNANISTISEPAAGAHLTQVNKALQMAGAMAGGTSSNVIDVTYGYMVDFFFRTNATSSKLKLQTENAQRIYTDSNNTDTLGHGSSMTFTTGELDALAVKGLMEAIRVVFLDPADSTIYGIGLLDVENASQVTVEDPDGEGSYVAITARLYLHDFDKTTMVVSDKKENAELCDLPTNTPKALSVMVYLDGDNVTNEDVANAERSATGTLNLQFASSADLTPMQNSALLNSSGTAATEAPTQAPTTGQ